EAGLLVAAERRGRIEAVEGVRPDDARPHALGHPQDSRALVRPHAGGKAVRRVVRLLDCLIRRAEGEYREHRPKDLFAGDAVRLRHVGEQRRREPEPALGQQALGLIELGAFFDSRLDEALDLLQLRPRADRPDVGVLVERVAQAQRGAPWLQLVQQRLRDRLLDQQAAARAADVALVEVDAVDDALDRLVQRRVLEDDVGRFAAELERQSLAGAGYGPLDHLADL